MTTKNKVRALVLSLLVTLALLGGLGIWALRMLRPEVFASIETQSGDTQPALTDASDKQITLAGFASCEAVPTGNWFYGGSTTWAAIRQAADTKINQAAPGFQLTYTQDPIRPPSSGNGIDMLIQGKISFSQSSRPIQDDEYKTAAQRGIELKQIPVLMMRSQLLYILIYPLTG